MGRVDAHMHVHHQEQQRRLLHGSSAKEKPLGPYIRGHTVPQVRHCHTLGYMLLYVMSSPHFIHLYSNAKQKVLSNRAAAAAAAAALSEDGATVQKAQLVAGGVSCTSSSLSNDSQNDNLIGPTTSAAIFNLEEEVLMNECLVFCNVH